MSTTFYSGLRDNKSTPELLRQLRDLAAKCEALEKEVKRHEQKNIYLLKDNNQLRSAAYDHERDARKYRDIVEKLNEEKRHIETNYSKCREYCDRLEHHMSRMQNSISLVQQLESNQNEVSALQTELHEARQMEKQSSSTIAALRKEVGALNKALDAVDHYQREKKASKVGNLSTENLRSIYYELGKRQEECHSLSITLADTSAKLKAVTEINVQQDRTIKQLEEELAELTTRCQHLSTQSIADGDALCHARNENTILKSAVSRLERQVEELSEKTAQVNLEKLKSDREYEQLISSLQEELQNSQKEQETLSRRVEGLQLTVKQRDTVQSLTEAKMNEEREAMEAERQAAEELRTRCSALEAQVSALRNGVSHALHKSESMTREARHSRESYEEQIQQLQTKLDEAEQHIEHLRNTLQQKTEQLSEVSRERNEAVDALSTLIRASETQSSRLQWERVQRAELERMLRTKEDEIMQLSRAKDNFSFAILDTLSKEKQQRELLERQLTGISSSMQSVMEPPIEASPIPAPPPIPTPTPNSDPAAVVATLESLRKSAALLARTAEHEDAYYRSLASTTATGKSQRKNTTTRKEAKPSPPRASVAKDKDNDVLTSSPAPETPSSDRLQSLFELAGIDSPGGTSYKHE